jgi:hypothetical protein
MRATARLRVVAVLAAAIMALGAAVVSPAGATTASAVEPAGGRWLIAHGDFGPGATVTQTKFQRTTRIAAATTATSLATAVAAPRAMRIAVVMLRLPGSNVEPVTQASMRATMFGTTNSVADWYSQMSGHQVTVTGTVYGYFDGVKSCALADQTRVAAAAAASAGYVATDYDHLVVYAPSQVCGFKGMGWVGANGVFLNGATSRGVIEHEIGHNLGLLHAGAYDCGGAAPAASCLVDYGDPTDVMGWTDDNRGYSAEHKYMLGWLPESEVKTVTAGTQTIALTASENPLVAGSIELIHVRAADGTLFAVDRRVSVGYDTGLSGVWIRRVADVNTDDTELVRNRALAAGETFTDAAHGVTITTVSNSGATASITVCVGVCSIAVSTTGSGSTVLLPPVTARTTATGARSNPANTSLTMSVPTGRGVLVGHTVVVAVFAAAPAGAVSCRDSRGNSYSVNISAADGVHGLIVCTAHVTSSLPPGTTVRVSYPAYSGLAVGSVSDLSGIRATARVDKKAIGAGLGTLVATASTATTAHVGEVLFGVEIHSGSPYFTPSPVYTPVGAMSSGSGTNKLTINPAFRIVGASGAYKFGGALGTTAQWGAALLTLVRG